jgi:hypothetical protein
VHYNFIKPLKIYLEEKMFLKDKSSGLRKRRKYEFSDKDSYSLIKVNIPGMTGTDRMIFFKNLENTKLDRFIKDYDAFLKEAFIEEAIVFFIELLKKNPGKIKVKSTKYLYSFTLHSYLNSNINKLRLKFKTKKISRVFPISNLLEEIIFNEIKYLEK